MPPKKLNNGKGALCSILGRYLHPRNTISRFYPNLNRNKRFKQLIILRQDDIMVNGKMQKCIVFQSDDFMDNDSHVEIHATVRWVRVDQEGPDHQYFDSNQPGEQTAEEIEVPPVEQQMLVNNIVNNMERLTIDREDFVEIVGEVEVDDDNEPDEANIPQPTINNTDVIYQPWGFDGFCHRQTKGITNQTASLKTKSYDIIDLFESLFPIEYLKETIIPETNKVLSNPTSYGEILRWIGLWYLMATTSGSKLHDFWSLENINPFRGAQYRFNVYMSRNRFNEIKTALRLSPDNPPAFKDRFWYVRRLIEAWNANMDNNYTPGCIICLDESMSV